MRRTLVVVAVALPLAGCGWFGGGKTDEPPPPPVAAGPAPSSDEVLKRDCADPTWKQQNLGLWYSVCRQPMKW